MTPGPDRPGSAKRRLGRTGILVSELGVGCGSLATGGTEAETSAMLEACWDRGLRYFDTAPLYGESELRLGRFLHSRSRPGYVVSTKVGRFPAPPGQRRFSFRRADVERSVEGSLRRLRLDHVDLLSIHDLTPAMLGAGFDDARRDLLGETINLLADLRRSGTVRALGVAVYDADAALGLLKDAPFDYVSIVGACTLLSQSASRELIPYCERTGLGVMAASPFHTGLLVTGPVASARFDFGEATPDILHRTAAIERVCAQHGVALPAAALHFALRNDAVASVVAGHRLPGEVEANLAWLDAPVPESLWQDLAAEGLLEPAAFRRLGSVTL